MPVTYEPWLVLLSIVMAIQGAYVGLSLSMQIGDAAGMRRRMLLAGAAFSLAVAIWTMHFVGMLAARAALPGRLPRVSDAALVPRLRHRGRRRGLCHLLRAAHARSADAVGRPDGRRHLLMHYLGMSALHASAHMIHAPQYVAASMAVAIAASGLALWLAAGRGGRPPLILSAMAFGIAVSGMHYTAMAGVTLLPHATASSTAPALSTDLLAIVVAIVAFCVSGMFLLFLVPDHARPVERRSWRRSRAGRSRSSHRPRPLRPSSRGENPDSAAAATRRSAAPAARRANSRATCRSSATAARISSRSRTWSRSTPMRTTPTIFNGQEKLFCPLAIGDVEQRLDTDRFVRVHRSHIVNIDARGRAPALGRQRADRDATPTTTPCRSAAAGSAR